MDKQLVRWGIIGAGHAADRIAQGMRFVQGSEIAGVYALEDSNKLAEKYGIPFVYNSYEELLNDSFVDVVYVAVPNKFHKEYCLLALNAGKAVVCEKPFALNSKDVLEIISLAQKKKLFLMEAVATRFFPAIKLVKDLIDKGSIGDVRNFTSNICYPVKHKPEGRLLNKELGGGCLYDLGFYGIFLSSLFMGVPNKIDSQAVIGKTGVDEHTSVLLSFPEKKQALIYTSFIVRSPITALILGTKGCIKIHKFFNRPHKISLNVYDNNFSIPDFYYDREFHKKHFFKYVFFRMQSYINKVIYGINENIIYRPFEGNGYEYEIMEVGNCIREGKLESELAPLEKTLENIKIMEAVCDKWKN